MKYEKETKALTPELASEWVDTELEKRTRLFLETNRVQEVSFRDWCSSWKWAHRSDVYTHMMHPYPGKLLAYVPIVFLASSYVQSGDVVLDPFAGSGTVLLEVLVNKFKTISSWGVELNPLGRLITKSKTTPLSPDHLKRLHIQIMKLLTKNNSKITFPPFHNRDFWFRKKAQLELLQILGAVNQVCVTGSERDFFLVNVSRIVREMSRADPDIGPPVIFDPTKFPKNREDDMTRFLYRKRRVDGIELFSQTVARNIERMRSLVEEIGLMPLSDAKIIWDDVRTAKIGNYISSGKIEKSGAESIDGRIAMVITSPPYMAAQKYIRTTRLELAWLGLASDEELALLEHSTVGTERVSVKEKKSQTFVGSPCADRVLKKVFIKNPERAAIAAKYYSDMRVSLEVIHRALKPNGICVIVVGNNNVAGYESPNQVILSELASENGKFITKLILKDPIRTRGMITKRHSTGGMIQDEYIIILQKIM